MSDEAVDLQVLARQSQRTLEEMRQLRKDFNEMMRLVVSGHDLTHRVERRQTELRDDLELMIKMELGGALLATCICIQRPRSSEMDRVVMTRQLEGRISTPVSDVESGGTATRSTCQS